MHKAHAAPQNVGLVVGPSHHHDRGLLSSPLQVWAPRACRCRHASGLYPVPLQTNLRLTACGVCGRCACSCPVLLLSIVIVPMCSRWCVRVCVWRGGVCVCACVRACTRACVCMRTHMHACNIAGSRAVASLPLLGAIAPVAIHYTV